MEIAGVLTAGRFLSSALGGLVGRTKPQESSSSQTADAPPVLPSGAAAMAALQEIAARYDVTDITPREFSEMLTKLREAGALSERQYQELSLIRLDLDQEHVDADESLNLLEFYAEKLASVEQQHSAPGEYLAPGEYTGGSLKRGESTGGSAFDKASQQPDSAANPSSEAAVRRRLQWLEKLAAMHCLADDAGLDAVA